MDVLSHFFGLPEWAILILAIVMGLAVAGLTQLAAFWLMFNPQEFKGIRVPFFRKLGLNQLAIEGIGWQGLVPNQKGIMAEIAVRLMTHKLLPLDEMIRRIPAQGLTERLSPQLQETADAACREVMNLHKPQLWESLPSFVQGSIIMKLRGVVPEACKKILLDLQKKPAYYLSLKTLVIEVVTSKPFLVVDLFKTAGKDPMAYIVRFVFFSGAIAGLVAATIDVLGLAWYLVLTAAVFSGALINKLAVESLFFHPEHGSIRLGGFTGFYFRNQAHIAKLFAHTAANEVMTTDNIVQALCRGPNSKNLANLIDIHVQKAIDSEYGSLKPLLVAFLGAEEWVAIKKDAASIFATKLESHLMSAKVYLGDALRIEETIAERLMSLPPMEFEKALRPVFARYEWLMPVVGAFWGLVLGILVVIL